MDTVCFNSPFQLRQATSSDVERRRATSAERVNRSIGATCYADTRLTPSTLVGGGVTQRRRRRQRRQRRLYLSALEWPKVPLALLNSKSNIEMPCPPPPPPFLQSWIQFSWIELTLTTADGPSYHCYHYWTILNIYHLFIIYYWIIELSIAGSFVWMTRKRATL